MNKVLRSLSLKGRESGQAMVEFIAVVVVVFFFLFFFLSLALTLVISSYMDYATFMAARTFKAMYVSQDKQEEFARAEFDKYTSKISGIARNFDLQFLQAQPGDEQTWGVQASYDVDLFYLPPVLLGTNIPSVIRLTSEAYLGRDPAFEDCQTFFENFVSRFGLAGNGADFSDQMFDNGC